jgi:hypothetical protein
VATLEYQCRLSLGISLPQNVINEVSRFDWLLILPKDSNDLPVLATFRKAKERDKWLQIAQGLISDEPLSIDHTQPTPSEKQLKTKAKLSSLYLLAGVLTTVVTVFLFGATTNTMQQVTFAVFALVHLPVIALSFAGAISPFTIRFRRDFLFSIATGKNEPFELHEPPLSQDRLYLLSHGDPPIFEIIPLSDIKDVRLEDWGHSWDNRDIWKIFDKNALPITLVVRLILNREQDAEREIQLPREVAEHWVDTLKALITTNSPMNEPQIDTSPRTLES